MALQTATTQWPKLYVATVDVLRRCFGEDSESDGQIYLGKPLQIKTRKELIATLRPNDWRFLRVDNGDLPEGYSPELGMAHTAAWSNIPESTAQHA